MIRVGGLLSVIALIQGLRAPVVRNYEVHLPGLSAERDGTVLVALSDLVRAVNPMLGGMYEINGKSIIVCRGTGTWGPRMRLWRPSEMLRVTLRAH